ncbi:MAG: type IV pilus secretin PilQ [Rhodocyclaceae bacterium]
MKFMRSLLAGLSLLLMAVSASLAQSATEIGKTNAIETIEVGKLTGSIVVKLGLRKELAVIPANFTISNPARIVFDFPDTENGLGHTTKLVNEGILRSYSVVQAGERSRLVLNLTRNARFETRNDGKHFFITLLDDVRSGGAAMPSGVQHFAQSGRSQENAIRDIQFRRNKEGAGVILVDLTSSDAAIDVVQKGSKLQVAFKKTQLPEAQRKRLEVAGFGTPVTTVTTRPAGEDVMMEIVPSGLWEHTAYQADNRFIVEVRPVKEDPSKLFQGSKKGYQGELISLNFQNIPLRELLHVFADITNFNIVVSDSVGGNVSLRLNDVPWDQALEIVLQQKNLAMRKSGNVIWIAPQDELIARDKNEMEARSAAVAAEVPRMEVFQLNYQKAEDFAKLLQESSATPGVGKEKAQGGFLSPQGKVTIDMRSNQVFVYDVPTKLAMIGELRAKVDRPPRQVLIEARIVEADKTFSKTLGARLGVHDIRGATVGHRILGSNSPRFAIGGGIRDPGFHTGQAEDTPNFINDAMSVNLPATTPVGAATSQPGQFSLILFNRARTQFLNLELSALEADRAGKIISNPRVVTANQVEALIEQGVEIPYLQASASGAANVAFKKAVLSLKVTPQITPEGRVLMKLLVTKDAPSMVPVPGTVGTQIAIDTKKIETEVSVENGGTVVIGGIFMQTKEDTVQRIPFLGDLPYVGFLFRQKANTEESRELLIFVTPKIVDETMTSLR